jgi:hypothetical protein
MHASGQRAAGRFLARAGAVGLKRITVALPGLAPLVQAGCAGGWSHCALL